VFPRLAPTVSVSGNTFVDNVHDLRLDYNNDVANTNINVIGMNSFSGSISAIWNNSTANIDISTTAAGSTFNGITLNGSTSLADLFAIEDKIRHKVDLASTGFVRVRAGEVYVTPNSFYSTNTTPSIQRGIDAATAGNTINIASGTYNEDVSVTKSVTISGPNSSISPNTGTRVAEAIMSPGSNGFNRAFSISSGNTAVTISGFKFDGVHPMHDGNVTAFPRTSDVTFTKNWVVNGNNTSAGTNTSWRHVVIADNKFEDINKDLTSSALSLFGPLSATVTGNTFTTVNFAAMLFDSISTVYAAGNTINGTGAQAIQLAGAIGSATVENNSITNANTISGTDRGAVRLYGTNFTGDVLIQNNTITGGFNGIAVRDGENITGKAITVTNNSITALAGGKAIYNGASEGTLSATCNWWGTAEHGEVGELITGSVTFSPFLTSGEDSNSAVIGFQPNSATCNGT